MSTLDALAVSFAQTRGQLFERLDGLDDDEFLWEPVDGMWTVRPARNGWRADWSSPDPDPPPVTTIAWRMWHIAVDALDSYNSRSFGTSGTGFSGTEWVGTAVEAVELTAAAFDAFSAGFVAAGEVGLDRELGSGWGDYADATYLELFLHAHREVTHHAAEIALLRDLYRSRGSHPLV